MLIIENLLYRTMQETIFVKQRFYVKDFHDVNQRKF